MNTLSGSLLIGCGGAIDIESRGVLKRHWRAYWVLIMHWNDTSETLIHLILYLILCRYCVWHSKIQSETQLVRKTDIFNTMKTDCSDPTSYGFMKFSSEKKKWDLGVGSYGEVLTPHRNVFHYSLTKKHRLSLIGHSLDQVRQHYQPCGLLPLLPAMIGQNVYP